MGVCPQFDVLWGELTGVEHLRLYGQVKVGSRMVWQAGSRMGRQTKRQIEYMGSRQTDR